MEFVEDLPAGRIRRGRSRRLGQVFIGAGPIGEDPFQILGEMIQDGILLAGSEIQERLAEADGNLLLESGRFLVPAPLAAPSERSATAAAIAIAMAAGATTGSLGRFPVADGQLDAGDVISARDEDGVGVNQQVLPVKRIGALPQSAGELELDDADAFGLVEIPVPQLLWMRIIISTFQVFFLFFFQSGNIRYGISWAGWEVWEGMVIELSILTNQITAGSQLV